MNAFPECILLIQELGYTKRGTTTSVSREKGVSTIHKFKNLASVHNLGFCGSIVMGRPRWGGATSPHLPQTRIAPDSIRCRIVSVTHCENCLQEWWFLKTLDGLRPIFSFLHHLVVHFVSLFHFFFLHHLVVQSRSPRHTAQTVPDRPMFSFSFLFLHHLVAHFPFFFLSFFTPPRSTEQKFSMHC